MKKNSLKIKPSGLLIYALLINAIPALSAENNLGKNMSSYGAVNSINPSGSTQAKGLGKVSEFDADSALKVLSNLAPDTVSSRGAAEARLFSTLSPGVVLVATDDGLGSGSVITSGGLILTNLHVVGDNETVSVVFKPKVEGSAITEAQIHQAKVVRRDELTDLALVQLAKAPPNMKVIPLGNLSDISVGSDVNAIGHPKGESWSYTRGLVSQVRKNYEWSAEDGIKHKAAVIQTQTPISPGNSGGPLLTDAGALVGVNSFKAPGEALNFAVSVDDVRTILKAKSDRMVRTVSAKTQAGECEPITYQPQRLKDETGSFFYLDLDCSGTPNAIYVMPDKTTDASWLGVDSEHTGKFKAVYFSETRNWKWSYSLWDTVGDEKADLICTHANGDIEPTQCEKYTG